jgi:hypothetical protein
MILSIRLSDGNGPAAITTFPSGMQDTFSSITLIRGWLFTFFVTYLANNSLSTASAPPAGIFVSSAACIIKLPNLRISSFNKPTAFARSLPLKEFEQTSSAKSFETCAGDLNSGFIS